MNFHKNDTYWRRVVQKKTKYMFTHLNETRANEFSYKKLGLKMKFIELIENTVPELWDTNYFKELSRQVFSTLKSKTILFDNLIVFSLSSSLRS